MWSPGLWGGVEDGDGRCSLIPPPKKRPNIPNPFLWRTQLDATDTAGWSSNGSGDGCSLTTVCLIPLESHKLDNRVHVAFLGAIGMLKIRASQEVGQSTTTAKCGCLGVLLH